MFQGPAGNLQVALSSPPNYRPKGWELNGRCSSSRLRDECIPVRGDLGEHRQGSRVPRRCGWLYTTVPWPADHEEAPGVVGRMWRAAACATVRRERESPRAPTAEPWRASCRQAKRLCSARRLIIGGRPLWKLVLKHGFRHCQPPDLAPVAPRRDSPAPRQSLRWRSRPRPATLRGSSEAEAGSAGGQPARNTAVT